MAPGASRRARLSPALLRELDRARVRVEAVRLQPNGAPPPLTPAEREAIVALALASADEPWPFPLLSQYARYWREGVRTDFETDAHRLGIMTEEAVLATVATGEFQWIDRAADGLMLLCELSTWCWVTHEESLIRHPHASS